MDDLNKNQIILLTLFVSFVTSIATGIVTVSLLEQAPQGVTRTINQVVERTVERVVPGEQTQIIKEVPVIITEEELIVDAINKSSPGVFSFVVEKNNQKEFVGSAVYVDGRGYFVTSLSFVPDNEVANYYVVSDSQEEFAVSVTQRASHSALVRVREIDRGRFNDSYGGLSKLTPVSDQLNIGQTVIALGATKAGSHNASVSIISSLTDSPTATSTIINNNAATVENSGGPLLHIQGGMIGLNVGLRQSVSAREIKSLIDLIN